MHPIIGILGEVDETLYSAIKNSYITSIESSGGIPILLPYVSNDETIADFIKICDGFLFTGGADIAPSRYNTEKKTTCGKIQYNRDELEFKVFNQVIKTQKPLMAICRGAQLVNVALGGTLYQDIPSELQTDIDHVQTNTVTSPSHSVNVQCTSPLMELVNTDKITANSFHHQAIKTLGHGLSVMATADDGVIEGIYLNEKRYLRAYQWHPERLYNTDEYNKRLFFDFIESCYEFKK